MSTGHCTEACGHVFWSLHRGMWSCLLFTAVRLTLGRCNDVSLCRVQLKQVLMKVADISNEARPMQVADPWIDCLLMEFFNQVWMRYTVSLHAVPLSPPTTTLLMCPPQTAPVIDVVVLASDLLLRPPTGFPHRCQIRLVIMVTSNM